MTPNQRAEKIVEKARKMNVELGGPVLFSMLAAEIQKAVDETAIVTSDEGTHYCRFCNQRAISVEEARKQWDAELKESTKTLAQMFTQQLRDEAIEECAKIAEAEEPISTQVTGQYIATKIRQLNAEQK